VKGVIIKIISRFESILALAFEYYLSCGTSKLVTFFVIFPFL